LPNSGVSNEASLFIRDGAYENVNARASGVSFDDVELSLSLRLDLCETLDPHSNPRSPTVYASKAGEQWNSGIERDHLHTGSSPFEPISLSAGDRLSPGLNKMTTSF
jgi:hypothetical protein